MDTKEKIALINNTYQSIPDDVKASLELSGIRAEYESAKPTFNGEAYTGIIPENLDQLDTAEIAELMTAHIAWTRYVNGALSDATAKLKCFEDTLSAIKAVVVKAKGKDSFEFDEDYITANYNVLWWSTTKTYLESVNTSCSNNYKVISRIVTLRGIDQEQTIRVNSVKNGSATNAQARRPRPWLSDTEDR